jgi:MFS family permease
MTDKKWIMLATLFVARTTVGIQFQVIASSATQLRAQLGLGLDQIGWLIGLYFVTGLVLALPAGAIGARIGSRPAVLAGLSMMTAGGLLAAFADTWSLHVIARVVAGTGGVLVNVLMTKMVTDWFVGSNIATAMAVFVSSWPVGVAVALMIVPPLLVVGGLQGTFLTSAFLCAVGFVAMLLVYRDPDGEKARPVVTQSTWPPLPVAALVVLAAMVWGWFNAGFAMVFSFGPSMLIDGGVSPIAAGSLISLVLWLSIASVPTGGVLSDRFGRPALIIILGQAAGAALIYAGSVSTAPIFALAALGLLVGLPAGPIMALPSRVLQSNERATGMGLFYTIYYLIMVLGPVIAGAVAKRFSSTTLAFQIGAAFMALGVGCFLLFDTLARSKRYIR